MKKVLVLPGWMTSLRLYQNNISDFSVDIGQLSERSRSADYVIGMSMGALITLDDAPNIQGKIILVNPPLPRRGLARWFVQWVKYMIFEFLFLERQKLTLNPIKYLRGLSRGAKLLRKDFSGTLDGLPKGKVVVVCGKDDDFFCDKLAVDFLRGKGIEVIKADGGHNWSEDIERTIDGLTV